MNGVSDPAIIASYTKSKTQTELSVYSGLPIDEKYIVDVRSKIHAWAGVPAEQEVGIEDASDLIEDLKQALGKV